MEERRYHDPSIIKNKVDLDGVKPSILIVESNRSSGKTTSWNIDNLETFKNTGRKFAHIFRYKYEITSAHMMYEDILTNIRPDLGAEMTSSSCCGGAFYQLFLDGESCGFAFSLSNVDMLKKYSGMFSEIDTMVFDEFQTESGKYRKNEINEIMSLMKTVFRGGGEMSREGRVVLLGNKISDFNPYYLYFNVDGNNINKLRQPNTKFLRGHGWVIQFEFNEYAKNSHEGVTTFRAFKDTQYDKLTTSTEYLIDTSKFIRNKIGGRRRYIYSLISGGQTYGIWEYIDKAVVFISKEYEKDFPLRMTFTENDHFADVKMLEKNHSIFKMLKEYYNESHLYFQSDDVKSAFIDILQIDMYN